MSDKANVEAITIFIKPIGINSDNFEDYGYVIAKPQTPALFESEYVRQWIDVAPFDGFPQDTCVSYFETKHIPIVCGQLESVLVSDEAYISTGMSDYVLYVADALDEQTPDENTVKAYTIPADVSVIVKKGVWHWAPFPVKHDQTFVLMLSRSVYMFSQQGIGVAADKVLFYDLKHRYKVE